MALPTPEIGTLKSQLSSQSASTPSSRIIGMYGSYYKLFRCSDGKFRLNLISEDEYLESKKRPISVCDVSSTTDAPPPCSHTGSSSSTSSLLLTRIMSTASLPARPTSRSPQNVPIRHVRPPVETRKRKSNHRDDEPVLQSAAVDPLARLHSSVEIKRQKRDKRSTIAVADLIAEYLPAETTDSSRVAACIQEPVASSTGNILKSSKLDDFHKNGVWNNWISSVGRRFPMSSMSVRQVLDVLDQKSHQPVQDFDV